MDRFDALSTADREVVQQVYSEALELISEWHEKQEAILSVKRDINTLEQSLELRKAEAKARAAQDTSLKNADMRDAQYRQEVAAMEETHALPQAKSAMEALLVEAEAIKMKISLRKALLYAIAGRYGEA